VERQAARLKSWLSDALQFMSRKAGPLAATPSKTPEGSISRAVLPSKTRSALSAGSGKPAPLRT
jgi:hypothetical protein